LKYCIGLGKAVRKFNKMLEMTHRRIAENLKDLHDDTALILRVTMGIG